MAKQAPESAEAAKTRKLRELREADEAQRRAQGIWGNFSVAEISHPESNAVFVLRCRGRDAPEIAKEVRTRSALISPEDHQAFTEWVARRPYVEFRSRLVAWNLSDAEAKRVHRTRIDQARAGGAAVVNPQPAPAPA
ncbi:MAG TPA: hypothetical protein VIF14_03475 [Alphaproteobacteria bacterium]|jgi:hypothetical protein